MEEEPLSQLADKLRTGYIDKKELLDYLAVIQAYKRAGKDVQEQEAAIKRELIKILIEQKRKNLAETWHEADTTQSDGLGDMHENLPTSKPTNNQSSSFAFREGESSPPRAHHNSERITTPSASSLTRNSTENEAAFFERTTRWKELKEAEYARAREEIHENELSGCTFHPVINTSRTYKSPSTPVVARLYSDSKAKLREWEHEKKRKEDEEVQRTCTFKPQTNVRPPTPTKTRPPTPTKNKNPALHKEKENSPKFSFTPTINKVPEQMTTASQYLATNAFERLSRVGTHHKSNTPSGTPLAETPYSPPNPPPLPVKPRPSSAPPGARAAGTPEAPAEQKSFKDFLARQQDHLTKKKYKIEHIVRKEGVTAQPVLCNHSKQIIKQKQVGSFLERLAQDAQREKHRVTHEEDECTFQPKILPSAKARKPRSVEELSIGDKLKHDAHIEEMRQKAEDNEIVQATFKPRTTKYPTQSRLKILTDPDSYLERIQKEQEMKEEQYTEWVQQQEKLKLEECTFQPEIHDAPRYVKRIARSMALARGNKPRASVSPPTKPEWL